MAGKNQITGGAFQDFEGNVLANGYLTMQLSHDEGESVDPGQVVGGLSLRVPLDPFGNIAGTVLVWPNDQLNPANSYYVVNAYRRDGTQAWLSPQFQTVTTSPSPFNVGAWVPNNPPSGGAPVGSILLQTDGVNNQSQSVLNLTAGSNITITDEGSGEIEFAAVTGAAGNGSVFYGPGLLSLNGVSFTEQLNLAPGAPNTIYVWQFTLPISMTLSKVTSVMFQQAGGGYSYSFGIYGANGNLLIDSGEFPFDNTFDVHVTNSFGEITLPAGVYYFTQTSDAPDGGSLDGPYILLEEPDGVPPGVSTMVKLANAVSVTVGTATNARSGGVMPSTLGTINAQTENGYYPLAVQWHY